MTSEESAKGNDDLGDDVGSLGSLSDEELGDSANNGDTWIEELECALLADCDPATLKKISEGRRIPSSLRCDYWKTLLALNDAGKVKLVSEYDLENQLEIRRDCEQLVEDISTNLASEPISQSDKLRIMSDFESTITTYVKARPELYYIPGNGWIDILRVLYHLELGDTQLYQMFFRIIDRYIPRDLSIRPPSTSNQNEGQNIRTSDKVTNSASGAALTTTSTSETRPNPSTNQANSIASNKQKDKERSVQAYHLLRLLIQYHDPELCSILDSRKVTPSIYVKDWFCSLFARSCTAQLALLIWDTHFRIADPFLIFFAAIVMVVNASDELKKKDMTQADMLNVLKSMPSKLEEDDIEDLYYLVSNHYTYSTPRSIRCYSHLFFMDTFGATYMGNESPEDGQPLLDLKTTQLTSTLDLSQYLCLPIVPAELFISDTAQFRSNDTAESDQSSSPPAPISPTQQSLKYFLVDCRPAEQYNAGHLSRAFHLDCSLMLREPSSFATAVQALLEIQRQVVASKSSTGGQHLCFIGSGQEEEDQYVNMVVASFLQKYQKYVSIVVGGFDAIHEYVRTKSELRDSFSKYIVDHNEELCKTCFSKWPDGVDRSKYRQQQASSSLITGGGISIIGSTLNSGGGVSSGAQSLFSKLTPGPQATATANLIAQSGASMFDKLTTAFVSKSSVIKERLVETLNTTNLPATQMMSASDPFAGRSHVSSTDKLGRRYTGGGFRYAIDDNDDSARGQQGAPCEPVQEIQIEAWQKQIQPLTFSKCSQFKGTTKYPGYVALTRTHLWIFREIPHNKGFASIAAKRPLDMLVQITSKRRQPDLIIFRYGYSSQTMQSGAKSVAEPSGKEEAIASEDSAKDVAKTAPLIITTDQLHIPEAFEVIRLIKREIVRIMDEKSQAKASLGELNTTVASTRSQKEDSEQQQVKDEEETQAKDPVADPVPTPETEIDSANK